MAEEKMDELIEALKNDTDLGKIKVTLETAPRYYEISSLEEKEDN